jgi:hypothetical protein
MIGMDSTLLPQGIFEGGIRQRFHMHLLFVCEGVIGLLLCRAVNLHADLVFAPGKGPFVAVEPGIDVIPFPLVASMLPVFESHLLIEICLSFYQTL